MTDEERVLRTARTLNGDEVELWRMGSCENFVSK